MNSLPHPHFGYLAGGGGGGGGGAEIPGRQFNMALYIV